MEQTHKKIDLLEFVKKLEEKNSSDKKIERITSGTMIWVTKSVLEEFKQLCDKYYYTRSSVIEHLIKKWMKDCYEQEKEMFDEDD